MRHLPVWFVTEPPGGPRSNPASYYRAGTRTRTVPRQKLGALSVELGGYRKRTEDRRQTTDDRRQTTDDTGVIRPLSSVLRPSNGVAGGTRTRINALCRRGRCRSGHRNMNLDPGAGLKPASRRSERRIVPFASPRNGTFTRAAGRLGIQQPPQMLDCKLQDASASSSRRRCLTANRDAHPPPPDQVGGRHPSRYAAIAFTHLIGALQCPAQCPPNPKGGNSAHTVGRSNAS